MIREMCITETIQHFKQLTATENLGENNVLLGRSADRVRVNSLASVFPQNAFSGRKAKS